MRGLTERLTPALRGLLRNKRFSALAIVSFAIAIALNTTMYSVIDAIVFPKVAMRSPDNLYRLAYYGDYKGRVPGEVKAEAIRGVSFVEDMALRLPNFRGSNVVERGSQLRTVRVLFISPNYFKLLGSRPFMGRLLNSTDEHTTPTPAVVSEKLWRQLFPERQTFDSSTITLDGQPLTVVGVLDYVSDFPGEHTDIWRIAPPDDRRFSALQVFNVVRVREGVDLRTVYAELGQVAARLAALGGEGPRDTRFSLVKLVGEPFRLERFHYAMIGSVIAVLLVACFNLANLQLARGLSRTKELATRAAVGATRRDIISLLVSETAWLAAAGLVLGLLLTFWALHAVTASLPPAIGDFMLKAQVSWRLFLFAALAGGLCLLVVGVFPSIRVSRVDVNELLKSGAGTGMNKGKRLQYAGLVVGEVGLTLALMCAAAMLIRTAITWYTISVNPALERMAIGVARVTPLNAADNRRLTDLSGELVVRARSMKGVEDAATYISQKPPRYVISIAQESRASQEIPTGMSWAYRIVSPSYLRTYGTQILQGRDFREGEAGEAVAIVDDRTAKFLWPGADPVGRLIKFGSDARRDVGWYKVIGVSKYTNPWGAVVRANQELLGPALAGVFVLNAVDTSRLANNKSTWVSVVVRGSTNLERLPNEMKRDISGAAPGVTMTDARRLYGAEEMKAMHQAQDFIAALFACFALLALGVASLGVYAVVSHTVSQRTREFGLRVALGATERDIRQSVLRQGNVMALTGIAVGLPVTYWGLRYFEQFLRGDADRYDSALYALVALVLFGVTLLASYVPARRAMRVNPVEALRND